LRRFLYSTLFIALAAYCTHVSAEEAVPFPIPIGLPPIRWPADNPYVAKKAELGKLLYFDTRLSSNGEISCGTCHSAGCGFSDCRATAQGIMGNKGNRHSLTVINSAYQKLLFWDGRAKSLEDQAKGPIANPNEMTLSKDIHESYRECEERIKNIAGYRVLFKEVFEDDECTIDQIAKAIATFERTILSGNSPYDRYKAGDKTAMTEEQIKGYQVFKKSNCGNCHVEPLFSDVRFLNIGIGMNVPNPDLGRYAITKDPKDWGSFAVPTLREVANTGPYMHDGSESTLEAVIDYYDRGGNPNKNLHPLMKPLHLSDSEKKELKSFLKALNGEGWQHHRDPSKFPE